MFALDHEPSRHLLDSCLVHGGVGPGAGAVSALSQWVPNGIVPSKGTCHGGTPLHCHVWLHTCSKPPQTHRPIPCARSISSMQEGCACGGEDIWGI